MNRRNWMGTVLLLTLVLSTGIGLVAWKYESIQASVTASANQPEPMESITTAVAREMDHRQTTTSIGTVLALRSVMLKNELAGRSVTSGSHPDRLWKAALCWWRSMSRSKKLS